jgi:tRNA A-37 threonylcarbamoyl transferase component Bud32
VSALLGTALSGRYRLDARVGSGGMSTVFKAFDTVLARAVAIKLMHREVAADSEQLERFRREARAVAQLSHPHIVTVIDYGEDAGRPYIVLEYVEGETLKARIRATGGLPVAEAVAYAIEIARALGCAHSHHIVHRDVKPQNVLIDPEGSAKVTDFGIARTLDEEGLTADGRVLGTTDYVSPEQALGHAVTGQSDLYSLGIVLWEMLVGEVPFRGETQVSVAMAHVRDPLPDVQQRRPEVSAALAVVIDRATDKDLTRRYADDAELTADLEEVLAIETARAGVATGEATAVIRTLPSRAKRRLPFRMRRPGLAVALLLLAIAGIVVAIVLLSQNAERGTGPISSQPPKRNTHGVGLGASAAKDYDPFGTGSSGEHPDEVRNAIDSITRTFWRTETYEGGQLGKPGVGLYLDARPGTQAKFLKVITPSPGFTAEVYAADAGPPKELAGWRRVGGPVRVERDTDIPLRAGGRKHRFWLLWITKLPPGSSSARVGELKLYR